MRERLLNLLKVLGISRSILSALINSYAIDSMVEYLETGICRSNSVEDSWCNETCPVCREDVDE